LFPDRKKITSSEPKLLLSSRDLWLYVHMVSFIKVDYDQVCVEGGVVGEKIVYGLMGSL
jgi:hypothetical protein